MEQNTVSIIVACYNQAEYLSEALESVLSQTYDRWECVIVNDGSPDNTEEIALSYMQKDMRFKYISQENKGVCTARNTGIASSCGAFILPLDADDIIAPVYLEKAVGHFMAFPKTKLVYGKAEKIGKENGYWDLPAYDYEKFIWDNCIFNSAVFKRSDYNATDGYNTNMVHGNEDWDFWLSLIRKDDIVHCIDEVVFFHRVKTVSRTTELAKFHLCENMIQLCRNHPDIYDVYKDRLLLYRKKLDEMDFLKMEIVRLRHTNAYRVGKFLLKPISWMRKTRQK